MTAKAIDRSLRLSVLDGVMHALMVGVSESYIGAFAVELGHRDRELALLLTVPMLVGALCQLLTATLVRWVGSRQRLVVVCALIQASSHVGLMRVAWTGDTAFAPLLAAATLFWGSGLLLAPAWSTWMGSLTRDISRERYFSRRSSLINGALFVGFSGAGVSLWRGELADTTLPTFAWLFVVAMLARLVSTTALALKIDPDPIVQRSTTTWQRVRIAVREGQWRVALFVSAMMFGAHVSVPFFTPYMLRTLELGMLWYSVLTAVAIASKAACFSLWRWVAERFGMQVVLLSSVGGMAAMPALWVWFPSVPGLLVVQTVSGIVWGGFEYASLQLLLRDSPDRADVEFFSLANSGTGVLQVAGAMFGSTLLAWPGADYHTVFYASSIVRALSLLLLLPMASALYISGPLPVLFTRVVSVLPNGAVRRVIYAMQPKPRSGRDDRAPQPKHDDASLK